MTDDQIMDLAQKHGLTGPERASKDDLIDFARDIEPSISHPDDIAVNRFAQQMKDKLSQARAIGRGGWQTIDAASLSRMVREHVDKGDPVDVANFCMFLADRGEGIANAPLVDLVGTLMGFVDEYGQAIRREAPRAEATARTTIKLYIQSIADHLRPAGFGDMEMLDGFAARPQRDTPAGQSLLHMKIRALTDTELGTLLAGKNHSQLIQSVRMLLNAALSA